MPSFRSVIFASILLLSTANPALAAHRSSVDRSDLDDNLVETFPIPVLFGVMLDNLSPDFGDSRSGGRSHEGQDMRAPLGTPVVSPTEAIVLSTGFGDSAGNFVYTANPGGETFRYMHLDTIADIKRGDTLDVGDLIGTVGDTGNAPYGVYHLHFEVRDDRNRATDPYGRLAEEPFSVKEKMSFLSGILSQVDDRDEYAAFLVKTFPEDFMTASEKKYNLPGVIDDVLEDGGFSERAALLEKLNKLINAVPKIVPAGLQVGDSGTAVSLMQTYIIFTTEGSARDRLAAAGATGYFGSITSAAFLEYQATHDLPQTGVFDAATKQQMAK